MCIPSSMLPGVQVTAGLEFFLCSSRLSVSDDNDSPVVIRCIFSNWVPGEIV